MKFSAVKLIQLMICQWTSSSLRFHQSMLSCMRSYLTPRRLCTISSEECVVDICEQKTWSVFPTVSFDVIASLLERSDANMAWQYYDEHRVALNSALLRELSSNTPMPCALPSIAAQRLQTIYLLEDSEVGGNCTIRRNVQADTAHVFITEAFRRGDTAAAQSLFEHFFEHRGVTPNSRSINIMIEQYRAIGDASTAIKYLDKFNLYGLQPDNYTLSSLVRLATHPDDIVKALERVMRPVELESHLHGQSQYTAPPSLAAPAVRCAVETLGRLGAAQQALSVAEEYLRGRHSIRESQRSGDALVTALIQADSAPSGSCFEGGLSGLDLALELFMSEPIAIISAHGSATSSAGEFMVTNASMTRSDRLRAQNNSWPFGVALSGRGLCALFTGLQRELRLVYLRLLTGNTGGTAKVEDRRMLERRLRQLRLASLALQQRLVQVETALLADPSLALVDGRLCDAILRTHLGEPDVARETWMRRLLPLVKRSGGGGEALLSIAGMAFEALMSGAGMARRPDLGLEVARTARTRGLDMQVLIRLARAYSKGRSDRRALEGDRVRGLGGLADLPLERGIEAELGVLIDSGSLGTDGLGPSDKSATRIRLQFAPPRPGLNKSWNSYKRHRDQGQEQPPPSAVSNTLIL